ncbi:hypothetical protein LPJ57_000992 [Coemansia sp. RSA 486]|nr:hypothetical protein LPJ57_000992 [Coemansia sp. RSA 486]KAJ2224511.1 hypothetical protein IWW45_008074 [Coemansia sp. RSA 485]KAJ2603400.1 hypothetical protein GGF39_000124 [Coemansia sp. RSA 1721]KAJ2638002.1 hypothetical protein GGF40_001963 [Coemansia sp. RSA 1286]
MSPFSITIEHYLEDNSFQTRNVTVPEGAKLGDLMDKLSHEAGVPVDFQSLFYVQPSKHLGDTEVVTLLDGDDTDKTLEQLGLKDEFEKLFLNDTRMYKPFVN